MVDTLASDSYPKVLWNCATVQLFGESINEEYWTKQDAIYIRQMRNNAVKKGSEPTNPHPTNMTSSRVGHHQPSWDDLRNTILCCADVSPVFHGPKKGRRHVPTCCSHRCSLGKSHGAVVLLGIPMVFPKVSSWICHWWGGVKMSLGAVWLSIFDL